MHLNLFQIFPIRSLSNALCIQSQIISTDCRLSSLITKGLWYMHCHLPFINAVLHAVFLRVLRRTSMRGSCLSQSVQSCTEPHFPGLEMWGASWPSQVCCNTQKNKVQNTFFSKFGTDIYGFIDKSVLTYGNFLSMIKIVPT